MRRLVHILAAAGCVSCLSGCEPGQAVAGDRSDPPQDPRATARENPAEDESAVESDERDFRAYAWLDANASGELMTLRDRFTPPEGFTRVEAPHGSFAHFLRNLPVYRDRRSVRAFDDRRIEAPSAAVVALDVGPRNLQQCADTAIRLHAEYLWSTGRTDEIAYHFTSGDRSSWTDWVDGERFQIDGSEVTRVSGAARTPSRETFRNYLDNIFMYAGTRSLKYDSEAADPVTAGSFFVKPGSPGHAVVVLDVATDASGRRIALLGQGFMPAQELHVIRGEAPRTEDGVWWYLPDAEQSLDTPSWSPFEKSDARRFNTQ